MNYRSKLLNFIKAGADEEMTDWISTQPLLDQVDIFTELKDLFLELAEDREIPLEYKKIMHDFEMAINRYQEKILDEKLAKLNYEMALDRMEKSSKEIEETTNGIRKYVIECIVTNADNAEDMKKLAAEIIALEKKSGTYDAANWKAIL
jgi:hypothetical protein